MLKKIIGISIICILSFAFTKPSFAIILENMQTNDHAVQPVPASVIANMMSKNFNIMVYNANHNAQNASNPAPSENTTVTPDETVNATQNNPVSQMVQSSDLWYWLPVFLLTVIGILFWYVKKEKKIL
jgi:hypothetical protein